MKMTGSQIILRVLREKGIDTLFGYPGGQIIPLFDALYDEMDYFKVYRPAHEQNGVHAADGYARSTGKLGVFVATSGPGATNAITGIATAYMDSVPLLVISGQVASMLIGKDSFQEVDITGVTLSITKHNFLVRKIEDLQKAIEDAIDIAMEGRPGPVLVDIPKDIQVQEYEYEEKPKRVTPSTAKTPEEILKKAVEYMNAAKKPIIYAGGGVRISKTDALLRDLAEKGDIPVCNSFMGLGTIERDHRLSLGFVGMHGFRETNLAVSKCDLLIAIGARFSDRVIGNPNKFVQDAKIIHIDIDGTEFGKNTKHVLPVLGELWDIFPYLIENIQRADRREWLEEIRAMSAEKENPDLFIPENIIEKINSFYKDNTIVVTDVGQHQMWTGQFWKLKNSHEFITSGGLGTMGFGLGAAIGAQIGNPDKNTIVVIGDGGFRMSCQELVTISKYKLPVIVVMLDNHALGMVRQWQRMFNQKRYSETDVDVDVDYVALARAYGMKAYKTQSLQELEAALKDFQGKREPIFLECDIDKDCSVYPIVPPGSPIDELLMNG